MSIEFLKTNPNVTPEEIAKFEALEKISLPEDYKQFLLTANGGEIDYGFIEYKDKHTGWTRETISQLYGLEIGNRPLVTEGLNKIHQRMKEILPPNLLSIAEIEGGHVHLLMSLAPNSFGTIYFWLDENDEFIHTVAPSFTDFLEELRFDDRPIPDDE